MKERTNELKKQVLKVGYDYDASRRSFTGVPLVRETNRDSGPNAREWHSWTLYGVEGGYRVYDQYCTTLRHKTPCCKLSDVLTAAAVVKTYPMLARAAREAGIFADDDLIVDLDEEGTR